MNFTVALVVVMTAHGTVVGLSAAACGGGFKSHMKIFVCSQGETLTLTVRGCHVDLKLTRTQSVAKAV